ncbi:MAG: hypothetical protein ACFCVH_20310 [Alphaproteobacteria bacterium]
MREHIDGAMISVAMDRIPVTDPFAEILASQVRQARMLDKLAQLADPNAAPEAADLAGRLLAFLMIELPRDLDDEEAVIVAIESQPDAPDCLVTVATAVREEHAAIGQLLTPVMRGLRYLSVGRHPAAPAAFGGACTVLMEFMRLHADYVQGTLLPLAKRLAGPQALSDLLLDMACRREPVDAAQPAPTKAGEAEAAVPA